MNQAGGGLGVSVCGGGETTYCSSARRGLWIDFVVDPPSAVPGLA